MFWISQTPQRNIAVAASIVEWVSAKYVKNSLAFLGDFYGLQALLTTLETIKQPWTISEYSIFCSNTGF